MTAPVITRDEAKLMLLAVAKQHADAGNAWQAASIVAAVDALSAPAPAIDLEQLRMLAQGSVDALAQNKVYPADVSAAIGSMRHLLSLIDGQAAPRVDLAADHTGMLVDYSGLIGSAQRALLDDPGISEMLRQLCRHLEELGRRWYAGDRKVVDEFLQLYCIESEARAALVKQPTKGEGE